MSTERVTISIPAELREELGRVAQQDGTSVSAVVSAALDKWLRGRLLDAWLDDYQRQHGAFTEEDMRLAAQDLQLPYSPPTQSAEPAA